MSFPQLFQVCGSLCVRPSFIASYVASSAGGAILLKDWCGNRFYCLIGTDHYIPELLHLSFEIGGFSQPTWLCPLRTLSTENVPIGIALY
jgi:hypothetical protein